jgi:ClpX C4-type zinc finger
MAKPSREARRCSFCGAPQGPQRRLIAGSHDGAPPVYICDECIRLGMRALDEDEGVAASIATGRNQGGEHRLDDVEPSVLLEGLRLRADGVRMADNRLRAAVLALRRKGVTWMRIGEALGISRQSAWERFSDEE